MKITEKTKKTKTVVMKMRSVESGDVSAVSGNTVLDALASIGIAPTLTVSPEEIRAGVVCWKFPAEMSQGRQSSS